MVVLGIDPGYAITGYGLVQGAGAGIKCVAYGVIRTDAGDSLPRRLSVIHERVASVIAEFKPDTGAIEEVFFSRNAKTAIGVSHGRGVAMLAAYGCGMELREYTPMQVKQAVVGYGNADKGQVQRMVRALLALEAIPKPDDAADALAVAICHYHSHGMARLGAGR
ncbi:MAG: crossover junction endodeoxyribonuclease RuvC [Oscillospiraceae bacterium]|nr:crossover junction endodeoxyribonuclease RuvC [Oscillospiraceae bacterium]